MASASGSHDPSVVSACASASAHLVACMQRIYGLSLLLFFNQAHSMTNTHGDEDHAQKVSK